MINLHKLYYPDCKNFYLYVLFQEYFKSFSRKYIVLKIRPYEHLIQKGPNHVLTVEIRIRP